MQNPKKLIRDKIIEKLKEGEWEVIEDRVELNRLYELKIKEELEEIKSSDFKDPKEFADLVHVVRSFCEINGFDYDTVRTEDYIKITKNGIIKNIVLTNLNPNNPSNRIYFEDQGKYCNGLL